jgi:hypothetical protein
VAIDVVPIQDVQMSTQQELIAALEREFQRLGLQPDALPGGGLAADAAALDQLLAHLRALASPATWREVFPDIPAHWVAGQPETWTTRYRPLGPYDYQALPTGPAVHVDWPRTTDPVCLDRLITAARAAGWAIHGGAFVEVTNPDWPTLDAMIILEAGTAQAKLDEFLEWLGKRSDVQLAAVPRRGDETYVGDL